MTALPDHLTAIDGTFLELEDADSAAHMHIGGLLVFGPRASGDAPSVEKVRSYLERRLDALPRYRQRLAAPTAGGLSWQRWVEDEHFDVARHVRGATLPAPGGTDELLSWAGEYYSLRLERSMPLWEIVVVDGLADGRWALATKTHHCLVDGVGSVDAAHLLLDGVGEALSSTAAEEDAHVSPLRRLAPDRLVDGAGTALHAARHPRELARRVTGLAELLVRDEVRAAPDTSLNEAICSRRTMRSVIVELDDARAIKSALGGTLNDVVLATVAAGLRAVLEARDERLPEQGLRAMVPMNVRRADEHGDALGNRISSLFVDLPVAEPHAVARYEQICERTSALKRSSLPLGADALLSLTGIAPPVLHHALARSLFAKRLFNVTITNVPGPPRRLRALGSELEMVWPLVPIASDHTVGVAIISYDDRLFFGINADRDSMSDVDVLVRGMEHGVAELLSVARAAREPVTP